MGLFGKKVAPEEAEEKVEDYVETISATKGILKSDKNFNESVKPTLHYGSKTRVIKKTEDEKSDSCSTGSAGSGGSTTSDKSKKLKAIQRHNRAKMSCKNVWRRFSCLFLSPIFIRHQIRFYIFIEVIIPVLVTFAILVAFKSGISWKKAFNEKIDSDKSAIPKFSPVDMDKLVRKFKEKCIDQADRVVIYFSPANNFTQMLMQDVLSTLKINETNEVDLTDQKKYGAIGLKNDLEVLKMAIMHRNDSSHHKSPIGVIFKYNESLVNPNTNYPNNLTYTIRMFDESITETALDFPYVKPNRDRNRLSAYTSSGFLGLQYAIESSYAKNLLNQLKSHPDPSLKGSKSSRTQKLVDVMDIPAVVLEMYYYPNFYDLYIRHLLLFTICCCLVVSYLFTSFFIVRQIVQENKSGIKDVLRLHGMPIYMHWVILVIHAIFFRGLTAMLMTVILYHSYGYGEILQHSSAFFIFFLLWMHLLALTFFNYFYATLVRTVSTVGLYTTLIGLFSFIIPITLEKMGFVGDVTNHVFVIIFPNWALYNILRIVLEYEADDQGANWDSMNSHVRKDMIRLSYVFILMISAGAFYLFLAVYRDLTSQIKLFPPTYNWWNFRIIAKQRAINKANNKELLEDIKEGRGQEYSKPAIYEAIDPKKKCYVRIRHLCKQYGEHNMALNSINLDIMHNEITVVLGHGGSGKSTLISILAGLVCPTKGYATIKNYDVNYESSKARNYTGLCPQQLCHFNLLTVRQHVFFSYRLRGYSKQECNRHASTLLIRLRLWSVRTYFPEYLTSEELRRLGIAMAMTDAPKVLLLDEPTSGMDAFGRREIWSILKSLKQHHTIIMTSNYMDEAEYLADRIALVAHGRLVCFGSVGYLKRHYDTGYFLKIEPLPHITGLDSSTILGMIQTIIGKRVREKKFKKRNEVDHIIIELPRNMQSKFADICDELDRHKSRLGFKKYTIKQVSLSDIFIKICESISSEHDAPDLYVRRDSAGDIISALSSEIPTLPETERYKPKFTHQIKALMMKRWTYIRTKHDLFIWKFIMPLILIYMVIWEAKIFTSSEQSFNERTFEQNNYPNSEVFYQVMHDPPAINFTYHIQKFLGSKGRPLLKSKVVLNTLLNLLGNRPHDKMAGDIRQTHIIALELRKKKENEFQFIGYHASGSFHSTPIIYNTITNIILSAMSGQNTNPYQIHVINEPFPLKIQSENGKGCELTCIIFSLVLALAYFLISSTAVVFPMKERRNGMKHMQLMTGISPWTYWLADYIFDCFPMLIITMIVGVIFYTGPNNTFADFNVIFVLLIFTALYFAWSGLAFAYYMSTLIPIKYIGYNYLFVLNIFLGILPFIWTEYFWKNTNDGIIVFIRIFFMLFPGYTLTCAIQDWFDIISKRSVCETILPNIHQFCDPKSEHFSHPGHLGSERKTYEQVLRFYKDFGQCCERICKPLDKCFVKPEILKLDDESIAHPNLISHMCALFLVGIVYWLLLIIAEKQIFRNLSQKFVAKFLHLKGNKNDSNVHNPKDIRHEALLVQSIINQESFPADVAFVIDDLTKSHATSMVINGFNLEVKNGECVGILGAGGSGKTTIVKMMSGEIIPTKGMCYIGNSSLIKNRKEYLSSIGYCAQTNNLFDNFTGIQMLTLLGRLRGIPDNHLPSHVAKWLSIMGLRDVGKDRCKSYGSGMQRRLCCAMALIGNNPVIVLDEITSGVDPVSRERLFAVLEHMKSTGHTIIFTSFHTEECMQLATKVLIIAEGNVQCIGAPQTLINKYARGFCITFRIRNEVLIPIDIVTATMGRVAEFKKTVENSFLHCDMIDEQDNALLYFLRDTTLSWGAVFRKLESVVEQYEIVVESYDVTEAAIEDLFILLTNKYKEMDNPRRFDPTSISKEDPEIKTLEHAARAMIMRI